jgi:hypothetical protein
VAHRLRLRFPRAARVFVTTFEFTMAEILQFRATIGRRRKACPEVSLAIEQNICGDADPRNLIDSWIVPKMINDWIARTDARPDPQPTDDNGERL